MTKLSYSIIPTWAARLPRGVGIVGGGVVGATQPRQPQQDRGQTQDRGHGTRGQGRSQYTDISEASLSLSSSLRLTLVPDTRRSLTNWQLRLGASVRFRGCEVVGGSWLRGWSLARPRTLRDDDGRQQVSLISPVMRTHRRHTFMTASSPSLGHLVTNHPMSSVTWTESRLSRTCLNTKWFLVPGENIFGLSRENNLIQSDTHWQSRGPIIPCLPTNFLILIPNLSILLEVWKSHRRCYFKQK